MKIFLLEDNKTLNETIKLKFEKNDHKVYAFLDGKDAYENITEGFSCFILDINVPNIDGIRILQKIRKYYEEVPIIIISATVEFEIIKNAYDFGCNDYLKKPFFIDELLIKVNKLCKISKKEISIDKDCAFNFSDGVIKFKDEKVILTKKENLMMNLFLTNINKLVTYENIQNYVWEGEYASLDAIRTLIKRLRRKLPKQYIYASSNSGYFFNSEEG
ncbi:response regulator transcription factor [Arcobacter sp.]|uniref:response regulator transcription factor n=1 Tax=Arcobacter sp. TaxID=1872629 RepID=UPI003C764EDC